MHYFKLLPLDKGRWLGLPRRKGWISVILIELAYSERETTSLRQQFQLNIMDVQIVSVADSVMDLWVKRMH